MRIFVRSSCNLLSQRTFSLKTVWLCWPILLNWRMFISLRVINKLRAHSLGSLLFHDLRAVSIHYQRQLLLIRLNLCKNVFFIPAGYDFFIAEINFTSRAIFLGFQRWMKFSWSFIVYCSWVMWIINFFMVKICCILQGFKQLFMFIILFIYSKVFFLIFTI